MSETATFNTIFDAKHYLKVATSGKKTKKMPLTYLRTLLLLLLTS